MTEDIPSSAESEISDIFLPDSAGIDVTLIRAANPGPMTLEGTNTWLVTAEEAPISGGPRNAVLIDPGPELRTHIDSFAIQLGEQGAVLGAIVLTHRHADHSAALASVEAWAPGVPVHAVLDEFRRGARRPADGDVLPLSGPGGPGLRVLLTPGHTSDSLSLLGPGGILFSGDTVLGRGTTVVTHPAGSVRDYLASIERLKEMAGRGEISRILPGHGPIVEHPAEVIGYYLDHRRQRLAEVSAAVRDGARTPEEVAAVVYAHVPEDVRSAALQSVRAQLGYLNSAEAQR